MVARRRTNKWDIPGSELALPPLGQRLVHTMRLIDATPSTFSSSDGSPGNLATHLIRLERDGDEGDMMLSTVAGYARRARVSFVWLALGVGDPHDGPFAEGELVELDGFPEPLRRATQAYLLVTRSARERVVGAAKAVFLRKSGSRMTASGWYDQLKAELAEDEASGVREKP